ncbi:transcription factor MYB23-like [Canna indica]|uniref:Transcription factor MYB23-like n=1 Tax=Canna indica TaxID=4628 RepID=A0AAQ3Q5S6_9LILI|nr:transcription factor MYB23-like [Canna indica]
MGCKMCEKPKQSYRKGLWSPDEDQRLRDYILKHGHGIWSVVPIRAGLQRNGKSCRLRWINYLRPGLKRSAFTPEEEAIVMKLQAILGNKWSQIAMHLLGRTDNEVKNHWNTYLKKKVLKVDGSSSHSSMTKALDNNRQPKPEHFLDNRNSQVSLSEDSLGSCSPSSRQPKIQSPFPKVLFADWLPMFGDNGLNCQQESTSNSEVINSPELLQSDMNYSDGPPGVVHGLEESRMLEAVEQIPDVSFHEILSSFTEAYTGFELNKDMFSNL